MTTRKLPTEQEVQGYMKSLSNWGRWGNDDEIGTMNLITEAKKAEAGSLVKEGVAVSCSRLIVPEIAPDLGAFRIPPVHYMIGSGEAAPEKGFWRRFRLYSPLLPRCHHHPSGLHLPSVLGWPDV